MTRPTETVPRGPRPGPATLLPLLLLVATLGACAPATTPSPSAAAPSATAPPSATPSETTSPAPTPSATVPPAATPTAPPTATPTPSPTASPAAFACTRLPYVRHSGSFAVRMSDVRVGRHPGFDRIVYEFRVGKRPVIAVSPTQPPFKLDPSDLPVTIAGSAFIKIRLTSILNETMPASKLDQKPGYPMLLELRETAGYEGDSTWIAGLSGPACVRVSILDAPSRLVIDIRPATP